jgi:hypothetical protein
MDELDLPAEMKVCNCANCGDLLRGESCSGDPGDYGLNEKQWLKMPPRVNARVSGRPYCMACMSVYKRTHNYGSSRAAGKGDEANPWIENAVRHLEG